MTTLAGKVLDDAGLPIEGAAVVAKDIADGTTKGSTVTNSAGVWFFDELDPLPDGIDYYVEITWNGKTKVLYGMSAIQLAYLTVGPNCAQIDPVGNVTLKVKDVLLNDNSAANSPAITLTGAYDSDPGVGSKTRTDRSMSLKVVTVADGSYGLKICDTNGTPIATINPNGDIYSGNTKVSLEGHTHAGGSSDAQNLKSADGTKWAWVDNNGFLKLPGGLGGIKKVKVLTVSGPGTFAHGMGEAPNVCLPVARGTTAYFSVGINNADATNVYIHASTNSEMKVLLMVIN